MHHKICLNLSVALFLLLLVGCRQLPDVGPFVTTTTQVRIAVAGTKDFVASDIRAIHDGSAASRAQAEALAKEVEALFTTRLKALDGMVTYAVSLANLVNSGRSGKQAVHEIGASVSKLVESVATLYPGAQIVVDGAVKGVAVLYGYAVEIKAANDLAQAVDKAEIPIHKIAEILAKDLQSLAETHQDWRQASLAILRAPINNGMAYRNQLIKQRETLYVKLVDHLHTTPPSLPSAQDQATLDTIEKSLAQTNEWFLLYVQKKTALETRFDNEFALIKQSEEAVRAWAEAHSQIKSALATHTGVDLRRLVEITAEMRDIYMEVKQRK